MPLSDYFRQKDPLVQAGTLSRPQNWQMRLGSLTAALGNMDRPGMLGQALAQAGTIYQDQRQGAIASAFERAQEEAKQAREDELFRMRQEEFEAKQEEARLKKEADKAEKQAAVQARAARILETARLELPAYAADLPENDYEDLVKRKRDEMEPEVEEYGYQTIGDGRVLKTNKSKGTETMLDYGARPGGSSSKLDPAYVDALVKQYPQHEAIIRANPESFATQAAQSVFDPLPKVAKDESRSQLENMIEDVRADSQWIEDWEKSHGGVTPTFGDITSEAVRRKQVLDTMLNPRIPDQDPMTAGQGPIRVPVSALKERTRDLRGGTKMVKPQGGETVGGTVMQSPRQSSPAAGKMGLVRSTPKKTEVEAQALARLESAVEQFKSKIPPELASEFDAEVKQRIAAGEDPEAMADAIEVKLTMAGLRAGR